MIIAGSRGLPCRVTAIIRLHFSWQLRLERQGLQYIRAVDGTVHFAGRSSEQPLSADEDVFRLCFPRPVPLENLEMTERMWLNLPS